MSDEKDLSTGSAIAADGQGKPQFVHLPDLTPYQAAVARMQAAHEEIRLGQAAEQIFMLSHPSVYTAGTSAKPEEMLAADVVRAAGAEIIETGRGGEWTWHGPGQRVVWPVLRLDRRGQDIRAYVHALEGWVIDVLGCFGVLGCRRDGLPGVWVARGDIGLPERLDKIAALGVRVSKWTSQHGFALNLDPDLSAYEAIIPCGVTDGGVTSLADLGLMVSEAELDMAIEDCFAAHFGPHAKLGWQETVAD